MRDNQTMLHSGVVLAVGLAMALAVYLGLGHIAAGLHTIPTPISSSFPSPPPTALVLSPGRFVVVHEWGSEVFDVDGAGHITKTDQFDPHYAKPGQLSPRVTPPSP